MLTICIILIVLLALDLLFTLALRCRKGHPKWELLKKYRYAHRGFHDKPVIPENSLPAFRRAIEHGFGAELDVHLLKDGTLAVFHDSDLRRCANVDGQIEDLTLEEPRAATIRRWPKPSASGWTRTRASSASSRSTPSRSST